MTTLKLYTRTVCPKCFGVKAAIEENNLNVEFINIDHDAAALQKIQNNNISSVPVLEVNCELIADLNTIYATLDGFK